jgi:hypothetical protein
MIDMILSVLPDASTHISHSALPHAPVVVDPPPGPIRRHTARLLRQAAARLDDQSTFRPEPRLSH